jgi:hypothetical protein
VHQVKLNYRDSFNAGLNITGGCNEKHFPGFSKIKENSDPKNFLKNPIKSCRYMLSELTICGNHLSFIIGKGANVWGCKRVVTNHVLSLTSSLKSCPGNGVHFS